MKHLFNTLSKLAAVAAVGLSISSCNRAEYAMLPKTTPYHATYGSVAKPAPATATEEIAVATALSTPQAEEVATEVPSTTAPITAAPVTSSPASTPAARTTARVAHAATPGNVTPRKMSVPQRALLAKVNKKVDKLVSKTQTMKSKEAASHEEANALNRYIKLGIILILVGLLVGIVFGFLGYILSIIGVVLIILGLLDEI